MPDDRVGASSVWRRKDGLADAELDGERLVWDPESGHVSRLDPIGSIVWSCLDGAATVDELADDLASAFGTPKDTVAADLRDLLVRLSELGMVVEVRPTP